MKTRWVGLAGMAMVAFSLMAAGQTAGAQQAGIDATVLAKANAGDAAAQVAVGESYAAGKGVAQDLKLAAEWYEKAAGKGDVSGDLHLALLYRDGGKGFARDMTQAVVWYRKVADQGNVGAQATMATLYSMGQGVEQSYVEAYYWLDLAAAVKGPKQGQYAANRQMMGAHITADELTGVQERVAAWKAAHPRTEAEQ
ncbi:MAG TPA: tetratricopeptide repeat protein [Terracidiphilus sp.]|nr:tetratricopeptide repeat protein [Terracidiphilus sp.]